MIDTRPLMGGMFLFFLLAGAGCSASPEKTVPPESNNSSSQPSSNTQTTMQTTPSVPTSSFVGVLPPEKIQNKQIRVKTAKGDIVFELYPDTAPLAVSNFVSLTESKFYNGLVFHRREEGFVIQGGDPLGNGRGGPGYTFADELKDAYTYQRGIVAMANRGPDTNGSQFFIMLADTPLPKSYTIFGKVLEGIEIVDQIKVGDEMTEVTVETKS